MRGKADGQRQRLSALCQIEMRSSFGDPESPKRSVGTAGYLARLLVALGAAHGFSAVPPILRKRRLPSVAACDYKSL